ncbi:MAG: VOC family protein [Alphaproteobacteria bacterium]
MIKPTGILHFAISVKDLERTKKFYTEILGCTYMRQNEDTAFFQVGEHFFVATEMPGHVPPNPPGGSRLHHAFTIEGESFDQALEELEEKGVKVLLYEDKGHRTFTGRHAYIQDPDGNAIELIDFHGMGGGDAPAFQGRKRRQQAGTGAKS